MRTGATFLKSGRAQVEIGSRGMPANTDEDTMVEGLFANLEMARGSRLLLGAYFPELRTLIRPLTGIS